MNTLYLSEFLEGAQHLGAAVAQQVEHFIH